MGLGGVKGGEDDGSDIETETSIIISPIIFTRHRPISFNVAI
jgi:hypothetical protein